MQLPPALRQAIDHALEGVPLAALSRASDELSRRYRSERAGGDLHLSDEASVLAYIAARLPATYAAVRASFDAVAAMRLDFAPRTLLDVGAGPGTALWAAADCWPSINEAALVERSRAARAIGERLGAPTAVSTVAWRDDDIAAAWPKLAACDLVVLSYVLGELPTAKQAQAPAALWTLTRDTLLIVEPGTPAGWQRILAARDWLIGAGAHLLAPCPHARACPLSPPDWCHFARRVARSQIHRRTKQADVPWEDEKYIYLAASRHPARGVSARVIARPHLGGGKVTLKLCTQAGAAEQRLVTRREGERFKVARRLDWGDALIES